MSAKAGLNVCLGAALLMLGLAGCVVPPSPTPAGGLQPLSTSGAVATTEITVVPTAATRPGAQVTPVRDVQIQISGKSGVQTTTPQHVVRVPVSDSPLEVSVHYPGPIEADIDAVRIVQPTTVRWRTELIAGADPNTLAFGLTGDQPGLVTLEINVTGYAPVRFSVALEAAGTPAAGTPAAGTATAGTVAPSTGGLGTGAVAAATAEVATAVPSTGSPPTQGPTAAANTAVASPQSVTLADDGTAITMHTGDRFVLALGEDYDWTVTSDDLAVLSRAVNVLTVRGSQGIYEAHQSGRTTLTATGDPACRKSQPPCSAPSRQFQVQIVVK